MTMNTRLTHGWRLVTPEDIDEIKAAARAEGRAEAEAMRPPPPKPKPTTAKPKPKPAPAKPPPARTAEPEVYITLHGDDPGPVAY